MWRQRLRRRRRKHAQRRLQRRRHQLCGRDLEPDCGVSQSTPLPLPLKPGWTPLTLFLLIPKTADLEGTFSIKFCCLELKECIVDCDRRQPLRRPQLPRNHQRLPRQRSPNLQRPPPRPRLLPTPPNLVRGLLQCSSLASLPIRALAQPTVLVHQYN